MRPLFRLALLAAVGLAYPVFGRAQTPLAGPQLDSLVARAMHAFNVPGLALTVVKDGQVVCAKGYGVRVAGTRPAVDANTLFAIASNSKAFTAAALGILVDEGKLSWDGKVIDYLPEFRMFDPYVTAEFTIRDLLTHRSGLGAGAGDLMRVSDSASFTIPEIIHNLRYIKPVASFRSRYAYDNILYLVAGELVAKVSGLSWDDFVEQRLLAPLQMTRSRAAYARINLKQNPNVALGHAEVAGRLQVLKGPLTEMDTGAGGIYASATDLSRWLLALLAGGRYGPAPSQRLFSEAVAQELWTPQVIIPVSPGGLYNTHFGAYGLGWFLVDVKGYKEVFHTGQDEGLISEIALLPELGVGLAVLTNRDGGGAVRAVVDQVLDGYLGLAGTNRVQQWADRVRAHAPAADTAAAAVWQAVGRRQAHPTPLDQPDGQRYAGTYRDPWLGEVRIFPRRGTLWFQAMRAPQLRGPLLPYRGTTFVVRWANPQLQADAFVVFGLDAQGRAKGITMQAVNTSTSAAYDFQDLDFQRVGP